MNREVKRVPLDFDWPLHKVWEGYLLPDRLKEQPCPAGEACQSGQTSARAWVEQIARLALMLGDDMYSGGTDLYPLLHGVADTHGPQSRPSADIREFVTGLVGREDMFDSNVPDRQRATTKLIEAAGLDPQTWGVCPRCAGRGSVAVYPPQSADAAWTETGPPAGEGWQLWENVSEGSPVSPVFATAQELAHWLTTPEGGTAVGSAQQPMTIEQACEFVGVGRAPTGFGTAGEVPDSASVAPDGGPGSQDAPSTGGSVTMLEGDSPVTELIFEAVSAWFQERQELPKQAVSGDRTIPLPAGLPSPALPARPAATALDWRSAADEGWRAANALRASTDYEVTAAGLPRRQPQAHLVPGRAGSGRIEPPPPDSDGLIRSPTQVRIRLSNYQLGLHRGRHMKSGPND